MDQFTCRVYVRDSDELLGVSEPFTVPGNSPKFGLNREVRKGEKLSLVCKGEGGLGFAIPADVPTDRSAIIVSCPPLQQGKRWGHNWPPHEPRSGMGVLK